jgi:hypothetical protein
VLASGRCLRWALSRSTGAPKPNNIDGVNTENSTMLGKSFLELSNALMMGCWSFDGMKAVLAKALLLNRGG